MANQNDFPAEPHVIEPKAEPTIVTPPEPKAEPTIVTPPEPVVERTTPLGTPERIATGRPLTNADVRAFNTNPPTGEGLPEPAEAEERLRRQTVGEAGEEPQAVEHHVFVAPPITADRAPGAFYGMSSTYIVGERDIFASTVGQVITSYTLDSSAVTADANGDKVVMEGTVLQASGAKVAPRTSGAAVGILRHRVNARYGDQDIGMIVGGRVRSDKCWDNGTFGSIAAGAVTQLNALGIYFTAYDV